jgi:hypothetical protein
MATLQNLLDDVTAETTLIASVSAFIRHLQDQIAAIPGLTPAQQAQIDSIFSSLEANKAALAAAIAAPTPPPAV